MTRVFNLKGPKKVAAAAAAIRTMQFMQRYEVDVSGRDSRLNDLQKKWWEQAMGRPKAVKEAEDMDQAVKVGASTASALPGWVHSESSNTTEASSGLL